MVSNGFQIYCEDDVISLQVLPKHLLLQLHSLLKSCAGLLPGLQTQRRPLVSWLKRGERPVYSGKERSRSACKERRLKGNKRVLLRDRNTAVASHYDSGIKIYDMSRRCREELERRKAEERAEQEAEAQRLIEEKRRREEEELRQAEEERAQAMREAALLQKQVGNANFAKGIISAPTGVILFFFTNLVLMDNHCFSFFFACFCLIQREEEQAKEREKAEQIRQEREILAQKEEAARQARKKVTTMKMFGENVNHYCHGSSVFINSLISKALPCKGSEHFHKAGFFCSGLRRSCGEPDGQILQIR